MTDDLFVPLTPATPTGARRKPCRHIYDNHTIPDESGILHVCCIRCGKVRDDVATRRGRTVRDYGNRAELDVARMYGGRKVGHGGGPTDVMGASRKVQVKTIRRAVPAMWRTEFAKLDSERDGRLAVLLLRFVRATGPDDYIVIRGSDFLEWYGRDGE